MCFFCKKPMSIWIRGKYLFYRPNFHFLWPWEGHFSECLEVFRNWGAPLNFGKLSYCGLMVFFNTAATNISNELHNMVFQNWGAPLNFGKPSCGLYKNDGKCAPQFWKTTSSGTGAWKFWPFLGGKTQKKAAKFFLQLWDGYKKYILQKKWIKTAIPALSSG